MLETYAYDLQNQTELFLFGIAALFTVVGFAVGLFLSRRSVWMLSRAPHIALWSLLFAAGTAVGYSALLVPQAMERGILWVYFTSVFIAIALLGVLYGVISRARAIDAYGNGSKAWFGIIPLIWFDLAFRKSLNPAPPGFGRNVLHGMVLMAALAVFVISKVADKKLDQIIEDQAITAVYSPQVTSRATDGYIRSAGLEQALRQMQAAIFPQQVDEVTSIITARAEGRTLTIHYLLDPAVTTISDQVRLDLVKYHCDDPAMRVYLEAGATMAFLYIHEAGYQVAHFKVVARDCTI